MTLTQIKPAGLSKPIDLGDNEKIRIGAGYDLQIYHNGSDTYLEGSLRIGKNNNIRITDGDDNTIIRTDASSAYLAYEGNDKLQTTSAGVSVIGDLTVGTAQILGNGNILLADNDKIKIGSGEDLQIFHDGNSKIQNVNNSCDFRLISNSIELKSQSGDEFFQKCTVDGAVELYYDGVLKAHTYSAGFKVDGIQRNIAAGYNYLLVGSSDASGVSIGLDGDANGDGVGGNYAYIEHGSDGDLSIVCDNPAGDSQFELYVGSGSTTAIVAQAAGEVQLYHNGSIKLNTESDGIDISGASFDTHLKILGNKFLSRSRWGYSTGYSGVTLGRTDTTFNSTIFMGVDTSANASGAFTGDGREVVFRNNHRFVIPNAANNGYLAPMHLNSGAATEGVPRFPQGILFGSDTANANILEDYEEGTWTPGGAWDTIQATYTKIGRVVHAAFQVRVNASNNTNSMELTNLPFACANSEASRNGIFWGWNEWDSITYGQLTGNITPGGTTMTLYRMNGSGNGAQYNQLGDNKYLKGVCCYQTA